MMATFTIPLLCPAAANDVGDESETLASEIRIDRQAQDLPRNGRGDRQILRTRRLEPAVHRKFGDERKEVPPGVNVQVLEALIQLITTQRILGTDENWEIGVIQTFFAGILQALNTAHTSEALTVGFVDQL